MKYNDAVTWYIHYLIKHPTCEYDRKLLSFIYTLGVGSTCCEHNKHVLEVL